MTDYKILYYEIYECPQCPTGRCFLQRRFAVTERNGMCNHKGRSVRKYGEV